jgi:hypothetical protein
MSLTGVWLNELDSIMVVTEHSDGALTGTYRSFVGRDSHKRSLAGRTSAVESGKQMLGFAVCFQIDSPAEGYGHYSLCTWSGWARGKQITTHWLLTISLLNTKDEWSSTLLGEDTFEKVLDTAEDKFLDTDKATLSQLLANARK